MRDTIKIDSKSAKMIAHRGLSGLEKENTAAAFVAAGNRPEYFGIETDVHNTKDGKFVIIHNFDLKRLAALDMNVETSTLEELQKVILSNPYGKAPRTDYRTPAFEDYLEICEHYGKHAVLEIKSDMSVEQLEKLVAVIKDYSMLSNTIFISFHAEVLVRLRGLLPDQPIQLLTGGYTPATLEFLLKHNFALDIAYSSLSEENIKELKAKTLKSIYGPATARPTPKNTSVLALITSRRTFSSDKNILSKRNEENRRKSPVFLTRSLKSGRERLIEIP